MKTLALAASAALLAFPVLSEPMWMLRATLCLRTGPIDVECKRAVMGPYMNAKECGVRAEILTQDTKEQSETDKAQVLFFATQCAQGDDT